MKQRVIEDKRFHRRTCVCVSPIAGQLMIIHPGQLLLIRTGSFGPFAIGFRSSGLSIRVPTRLHFATVLTSARFSARLPVKTRKNEHANCRAAAIKRRSFFRQMAPSVWKRVYLAAVIRPTSDLYPSLAFVISRTLAAGFRYLILKLFNEIPKDPVCESDERDPSIWNGNWQRRPHGLSL